MQKKKRQIPLDVLKELDVIKDINKSIFELHYPDDCILEIRERNIKSIFTYKINNIEAGSMTPVNGMNRMTNFIIRTKTPSSSNRSSGTRNKITLKDFKNDFLEWTNIVGEYHKLETIFDDPIAKAFEDEFYQEWKIIDDEAGNKPFSTDKIILLDSFLEDTKKKLLLPEYNTPENKNAILEISDNIEDVRANLTSTNQNSVLKQISKVLSKIAKLGVPYIKEFFLVSKNETFKAIFHKSVAITNDLISNIDI